MTTSIPTPLPNSASNADNSQPGTGLDAFISSLGSPAQAGAANAGPGSDFSSMLDASSGQPTTSGTANEQTAASAAEGASEANGAQETNGTGGKTGSSAGRTDPQEPSSSATGPRRDVAEAVASMLSPLWIQAVPSQPAMAPVSGAAGARPLAGGGTAQGPGTTTAPAPEAAVGAPQAGIPVVASLPGLYGKIAAAMNAALGAAPPGAPAAGAKGQRLPGAQAQAPVGESPEARSAVSAPPSASGHAENFAGGDGSKGTAPIPSQVLPKKNFLVADAQDVKSDGQRDGTGIAKAGADMPASPTSSHPTAVTPGVTPSASPSVAGLGGAFVSPFQAPASPASITPTLAPVLALRAVETVLNVVDAQQVGSGQGGVVKLDFNFGGEALAVHVQMRGGEVHTEFRTNSTELRSALSSQWSVAAGQRDADGVRLVEPVFSSAQGGSSTANGNSATTSFSSQQQGSQQQASTGAQPAPIRFGRSTAPLPDAEDPVPASASFHPTSQHLAAVA